MRVPRRYVIPAHQSGLPEAREAVRASEGDSYAGRPAQARPPAPRGGLTSVARGRLAEDAAAEFLEGRGHRVLARNYRSPVGEADLITRDGGRTVIVEVKARSGGAYGAALESVGPFKERRLRGVAAWWMAEHGMAPRGVRFDLVTVHLGPAGGLLALYHLPDVLGSGR